MAINISRKNSIYLGLGIIALFFACGIIMLLSSGSGKRGLETAADADRNGKTVAGQAETPEDKPNLAVPVTMNKFERHAIKDGRKLWEVVAERGRYLPAQNQAELEDSRLFFYRQDDSTIKLTSSRSKITFSGTELTGADLSGGVELIYNDDVQITSDTAVYNKEEDTILIPGKVSIHTDDVDLEGMELKAYVSKREVYISRDVSTVIRPKKDKQ